MSMLRTVILALCLALGTAMLGWWAVPLVALGYGVYARATRSPGFTAAFAGLAAWGGYLALMTFSGAPVATLAARLATSMQLPTWGPLAATLLFPAVLAGTASYLGARLGGRYLTSP